MTIFMCKCAHCRRVSEGDIESTTHLELDFVDMVIRFVCPHCKKVSEMSIMTQNKLKSSPLPKLRTMR